MGYLAHHDGPPMENSLAIQVKRRKRSLKSRSFRSLCCVCSWAVMPYFWHVERRSSGWQRTRNGRNSVSP